MAGMTLYPAIDVLGGRCARLDDGAPTPTFDVDPVVAARRLKEAGAEWLHVTDLDGALTGKPQHLGIVRAIVEATGLPLQVGGGLCGEDAVAATFAAGAQRVLLGTAAARETELLAGCLARWGERIAVSVDAHGGQLTVAGWLEVLSESALACATRMARVGVHTLVVTNVTRNGSLAGGDAVGLEGLRAVLPETSLIAAGKIVSPDDVRWLAGIGMNGVVLGRGSFDGTLDFASTLRIVSDAIRGGAGTSETMA